MEREISIPSQIESISIVENFIDELSIELGLVADVYGNVLISVIEAVTNSIVHGNKMDSSKFVKVKFLYNQPFLNIIVSDEGPGFLFDNVPDPTKPDNVEKPDGRGVFLMKHLADEITFDRAGATVNLKYKV